MTNRKKSLVLIQLSIFFFAVVLLYNTYGVKNKKKIESVKIEIETKPNVNSFTDIEYSGFDLSGNKYVLNAKKADFKTATPELINMKEVKANFYLKDNTILIVTSNKALYNNVTLNIDFIENVKSDYLTNTLLSDFLSYSNTESKLIATGNVRGESIENGEFIADNVEYNLTNKTLDFSMFGSKQVNIKLKN